MQVRLFSVDTRFDDPNDFRAGAALFFNRVSDDMLEAQLRGVPGGAARDATALFQGDDARWRLVRPLDSAARPDAFVMAPAQAQYLIRPPQDALYDALILVGLPQQEAGDGAVTHPALAGNLGSAAGSAAGQIFTIEPTQPDRCTLAPSRAAAQAQAWLKRHLK